MYIVFHDNEGRSLVPVGHAGRKCECQLQILRILGIDLIKRTVSGTRVVLCWANPLSVVGFELSLIGRG